VVELSVITVNWNSAAYLLDCVRSVSASAAGIEHEHIVVDNASYDGSDRVVARRPEVVFVQSDRNVGFSGANNLGSLRARGELLLFLNPDTMAQGDAIRRMILCLRRATKAGAVGCRLVDAEMNPQMDSVQRYPSPLGELLDSNLLRRLFPSLSLWGMAPLLGLSQGPLAVEAVSGACLLMRKSVFESIGRFSTDYFMYGEDIDLCYRVRARGLRVYVDPGAVVTHYGGGSTGAERSAWAATLTRHSVHIFLKKNKGRAAALSYRATTYVVSAARILLLTVLLVLPRRRASRDAARRSLSKWSTIFSWTLSPRSWLARNFG
jgi:GT2 family glycosyltransferase